MADIRQSSQYAKHLQNLGWIVERIDNTNYFVRKVPIIRGILKIQRPEKLVFGTVEGLQKKHKPFQTIIEPKDKKQAAELQKRGYRLSRSPYLPTKTVLLKLTNKENLFSNFKKDTRYALRKSKNVSIISNPPIKNFHASWKSEVRFSRYVPSIGTLESLQTTFKSNMIILASHNDINDEKKYSAGSLFLKSGNTVYYWQSFSGKVGRSTLAQYAILWNAILWAISKRAIYFDFEGIYDERFPNKQWSGFTHFKKQFGGKELEYPGCFVKNFWYY